MAEPRLTTTWRLTVEVLSPLHVGAGGPPLLADYDYVAHGGDVWVLDLERALARLSDEELAGQVDARASALLRPTEYAECARYRLRLRGDAPTGEVLACVRDGYERPYLPGSSLKGALRTALAWAIASADGRPLPLDALRPSPQWAARPVEQQLFGPNPNQDLLRALRVADLAVEEPSETELAEAAIYSLRGGRLAPKGPGYRWYVETLPVGARLAGSISLDEHPFGPQGRALAFHGRRGWLADVARHCRAFARALAEAEARFYGDAGPAAARDFYERLSARIERAAPDEAAVQLGWGTGWTAKTLGLLLQDDPRFPDLVDRYRLDRGQGAGTFPKTRRLVERGGVPEAPLGWAWLRLTPE